MDWIDRERNTARLVRACWDLISKAPTADQLHALCRLTWITKNREGEVTEDNTRAVVAPALSAIFGVQLRATTREFLAEELEAMGASEEVTMPASLPVGFVNFYAAFRNSSLSWIGSHRKVISRMFASVRAAKSDRTLREAYLLVDQLPPIPRAGGRDLPAFNLLTPVMACLDSRERAPVVNARASVQRRLGRLGLARSTLVEQFEGLVNLLGQAGLDGAFALDTMDDGVLEEELNRTTASGARPQEGGSSGRPLVRRDDRDIMVIREALSGKHRLLHNTMTNALLAICQRLELVVEQGSDPEFMFDALIRQYAGTARDLLVEAKTSDEPAFCRMAVGQLLDYRRGLRGRARIDLAVLFPSRPREGALLFLADVGVKAIWLSKNYRALIGDLTL